jgi:hypothetical protein
MTTLRALLPAILLVSTLAPATVKAEFSHSQICRAGIAGIMGRSPKIVRVTSAKDGVYILSYVRENDGTRWSYRCKIAGNRLIWGAEFGRWRDFPLDGSVEFESSGGSLAIMDKFTDGSTSTYTYTRKELAQ